MIAKPIPETISYLIVQLCKAHRGLAEDLLSGLHLHAGQEIFLLHLWEQDGQTQSQLAENMCVQPPTVNKMLSRLEAAGLVERRPDPEDNRVSRVYLTAQSRALEQEVEAMWNKLEERTLANLSLEERLLLRRLLMQVHQNLAQGS
jgi:DNA-binding MarR family transcriptional regulator